MISDHPENPNLCYRWTKSGKPHISGLRYVCAGCRKLRDVQTLRGLANADCRSLWMTLRAKTAVADSPYFDEILLRHLDEELAIFTSPRQLHMLKKSAIIVSDGTFKQAPKGIYQVYRVFGFAGGTHAVPLCTALMRGKTRIIYGRFWSQLRQELEAADGELQIFQANFDFEPASVEAFRQNFVDSRVKMCCFHVRQALQRRIQRMGLAQLYTSREDDGLCFQRLIRKIGALQFCPPNYMNRSIHVLRGIINGSEMELAVRVATNDILDYYVNTWVKNSIGAEFFNLFDVPRHRTINHAESYHGRQRWFYQPHQLLGRWIINFQEVSHAEEETAMAIEEGRQQPNQPLAMTAEIDAGIEREKANVLAFLNTDFEEEQFVETLSRYFGRIGHLIGFNAPPMVEIDEQAQEAAALEEAEASLDESEGDKAARAQTNVAPAQIIALAKKLKANYERVRARYAKLEAKQDQLLLQLEGKRKN
uniref:MULE transposase domain-containing protein n=1 Tax=Globodera rostochiensis TaxID=31243 RepID=A0A914I2W2_GLORO